MKKALVKLVGLSSVLVVLTACNQSQMNEESVSSEETGAVESVELVEREVTFEDGTQLLSLDEEEKAAVYAELDEVAIYTGETDTAAYSQLKPVESETAYAELMVSTNNTPAIVYLGFDECPFCKVFSPKINQLASELGVEIHYYNTKERGNDATFADAMQLYNVDTVPHAFIVEDVKVASKVNHESSMEEIEAFLLEFVDKTQ
ncbi:TlpA family protein disulfide reductase [Fundicoccus sp. Sow4_D5]|uniref:TlpA family protein disulfide reductase n=1 Tax=unclassified Fundicoccus TaxID=2761543 RepID=UPI003F91DAA0